MILLAAYMLPVAVAPYQMRPPAPRAPLLSKPAGAAVARVSSGSRQGTPSNHAVVHGLSLLLGGGPGVALHGVVLPEPRCRRRAKKPREARGGGGARGSSCRGPIRAAPGRERERVGLLPAGVPRTGQLTRAEKGGGVLQAPVASRAESSDRRVSGPSVERARLRGRGGPGSLCLTHSSCRPPLQTHFGWRPAINSELARTRGIRLSN